MRYSVLNPLKLKIFNYIPFSTRYRSLVFFSEEIVNCYNYIFSVLANDIDAKIRNR